MLKGLGEIGKKAQEAQENMSKDRIRYLSLRNAEVAHLRFLTDEDGVILANFHTVEEMTPKGSVWRKYYCSGDSTCKYCAQGLDYGEMIFLWCYCRLVLHKQQNPRLDSNPEADKWVRVKSDGEIYYKEDVNDIRVFRTTPGKGMAYKKALIGYANTYKTLLDREYKWSREGSSKDTIYTLIPKDPSKMSEEVRELIKTLPDLSKVVSGEITSFATVENGEEPEELEETITPNKSTSDIEVIDEEELSLDDIDDVEELF